MITAREKPTLCLQSGLLIDTRASDGEFQGAVDFLHVRFTPRKRTFAGCGYPKMGAEISEPIVR